MASERLRMDEIGVEPSVLGSVNLWSDSMVGNDRQPLIRGSAKCTHIRQRGIYDRLQQRADDSHFRTTRSHFRGVPRVISQAAWHPRTSGKWRGCSPCPGRIERVFFAVKRSPCCISSTTKRDRRKVRLASSWGLNPKCTRPKAFSAVRIASTVALNSCGSRENALSGPGFD